MIPLLTTYWPAIAGALALFLKPGEKPIWKMLVDVVARPKPNAPGTPNDILSLLPVLLDKLAKKPPVPTTPEPKPQPKVPSNLQDIVALILDQLSQPETKPIDEHEAPIDQDMAHLVACSQSVAAKYPEYDIAVTVNASGVNVQKVKRAESK